MTVFRRQILCQSGEPRTKPGDRWTKWLVAFWFQVPEGKRLPRNLTFRPSPVTDAHDFERHALADGAILEVMATFTFPLDMPMAKRREIIDLEWREQHLKRLGFLPDAVVAVAVTPSALAGDRSASA